MSDDLIASYRFIVKIKGKKLGFRSISGIKMSAAFEPLQVGGQNNYPTMLAVPVKEAGKLVMERGASTIAALSDFTVGKKVADSMEIEIQKEDGKKGVSYSVTAPLLESIELSKLDAQDSSVLIETFSVYHSGIERC